MTGVLPAARRAEGIAYWGLASVIAMVIAPSVGFWMYRHSWTWLCIGTTALNLAMAGIAWRLEEDKARPVAPALLAPPRRAWIERRVLVLSLPLFLYAYGYGAISSFSAVYADALGVTPKTIYLTTLALVTLVTRPIVGRLGDRLGYRRLFLPCLVMMAVGLAVLPVASTATHLALSAGLFALGFGSSYPVFAAYVMQDVGETRRGAAFGAILAAFDTGIGTGSTMTGWLAGRAGFPTAFAAAAVMAAMALPMFLFVDKRFGPKGALEVPPVPAPLPHSAAGLDA
jgi:MFS family permease